MKSDITARLSREFAGRLSVKDGQMSTLDFEATTEDRGWGPLFAAWLLAVTATLGALFIGEVMGRTPCVLCWYQRIAMFPLALFLGLACLRSDHAIRRYVIPLASIGGLIALWHSLLFAGIIPEPIQPCERDGPSCSGEDQVLFGILPLPYLSLFTFIAIALLLAFPYKKRAS